MTGNLLPEEIYQKAKSLCENPYYDYNDFYEAAKMYAKLEKICYKCCAEEIINCLLAHSSIFRKQENYWFKIVEKEIIGYINKDTLDDVLKINLCRKLIKKAPHRGKKFQFYFEDVIKKRWNTLTEEDVLDVCRWIIKYGTEDPFYYELIARIEGRLV